MEKSSFQLAWVKTGQTISMAKNVGMAWVATTANNPNYFPLLN
jgi:hypothetical protein